MEKSRQIVNSEYLNATMNFGGQASVKGSTIGNSGWTPEALREYILMMQRREPLAHKSYDFEHLLKKAH